ncbi:TetR/AcrR family transcriptional regulator [Gordonia hydrophobica]|uniref:TetR/AcrR family transcriptional regulator n=1 Tax=Gordonia hydrophobica TaxID=40516 RepID=A0ABZ2U770_9ACTN|nr:TetR/AcrR family transcriptional regulator [Gordonia hydrophobica]
MKPGIGRRKTVRPSGEDRVRAIMATAEQLLGERAFADISVDDLARGAGISRPTFYFYFSSKEEVLFALAQQIVDAANANVEEIDPAGMADPAAVWRARIVAYFNAFGAHRSLTVALSGVQGSVPELDQRWSEVVEGWVRTTASNIDAERARGAAPTTLPSRDLAVALLGANQAAMQSAFIGRQPALSDDTVVDTLVHVWLGTIYSEGVANG